MDRGAGSTTTRSVSLTVYHYPNCSTCRKALQWLEQNDVDYKPVDIVAKPPSASTLKKVRKLAEVPIRKLFNTSGQSYRNGGYKKKLETMSESDALDALAADGKLIKRPLAITGDVALVGFRAEEWATALDQ